MAGRSPFSKHYATATTVGVAIALPVLTVLFVSRLARYYEEPMSFFTRDPAAVLGANPLVGAISSLGVLMWASTTAICLVALWLLAGRPGSRPARRLFLGSAVISALLLFDDLFMFHEQLAWELGFRERIVIGAYGVFTLAWATLNRAAIRETDWFVLAGSIGFFAVSLGVDQFVHEMNNRHVLEDGAKLVGISLWLSFHLRAVNSHVRHASPPGSPLQMPASALVAELSTRELDLDETGPLERESPVPSEHIQS